jgi:hypothetical protein
LKIVSFHILQSPSDTNPIVVEREWRRISVWHLSLISASEPLICTSESKLSDILWFFSHYAPKKPKDPKDKRYLTLAKNPHFYDAKFPTPFPDTFKTEPTEDYQGTMSVLTNNEHRVFLELGKTRRAFDNIWKAGDTLIFKGSYPAFITFP